MAGATAPTTMAALAPPSSGNGTTRVLIVIVVLAVALYYVYTHRATFLGGALAGVFPVDDDDTAGKGAAPSPAAAKAPTKPTIPKPTRPAPTGVELEELIKACKLRGIGNGTCVLDPNTNEVAAKCKPGYYGVGCARRCNTGGTKATVYTAGYESGPGAATCKCPSDYHFMNNSVVSGCELSDATENGCEQGWHGEKCDKKGKALECQNGTQSTSTGKCVCNPGFEGELCQFPSTWCQKSDSGATLDVDTQKCKCTKAYKGARCTEAADGYLLNADKKSVPWTDVWKKVGTSIDVTFEGAGHTSDWGYQSCGNSNNCTQSVPVCSLLAQKAGGVAGCNSMVSLCHNGLVESKDGRCSLMEKRGAGGDLLWGLLGTLAPSPVIGGATMGALSATGVIPGDMKPWFSHVDVPQGVSFGVWKGEACQKGETRRAMSPCLGETCTYSSPTYQDPLAFQFALPPDHYAECDGTYYLGPASSSASGGKAPTAPPGDSKFITL